MEIIFMKPKLIALFLALTMTSWAQTSTPNAAPNPEQKSTSTDAKAACPCCDKIAEHADMHDGMACMRHAATKGDKASKKDAMACCGKDMKESCCSGKDGKSCLKDGKMACGKGKSGEGKEMACCAEKAGKGQECCGGMQCGKHDHSPTPGN